MPMHPTNVSASARRIQKELAEVAVQPPFGCSAGPKGDNIYEWAATLIGPPNTPYADGVFFLDISFPLDYPFSAPAVTYRTKIYHCNVGDDGAVHLALLQEQWSPAMTVSKVLQSLYEMLQTPRPDSAERRASAQQLAQSRVQHDRTAADWAQRFASL